MGYQDYYVFHDDDYANEGGIGWQYFATEQEALDFITGRIKQDVTRSLDNYALIEGKKRNLKAIETVTKIVID